MSTPELGFERYRPLAPRARWARIALVTMIVADVLAVLSGVREYVLLERLETDLVTAEELEASDRRQQVVALAQFAVFIFAAIFFIRWLHRAYANIVPLGAQYPRYSTGTAIWSWFVPILNLWRPKQVINDVWRASDPEASPDQGDTWQREEPPIFYAVWVDRVGRSQLRVQRRLPHLPASRDARRASVLLALHRRDRQRERACCVARDRRRSPDDGTTGGAGCAAP